MPLCAVRKMRDDLVFRVDALFRLDRFGQHVRDGVGAAEHVAEDRPGHVDPAGLFAHVVVVTNSMSNFVPTPITVSRRLPRLICLPIGSSAPKSWSFSLNPITHTGAVPRRCRARLMKRPAEVLRFLICANSGVTPYTLMRRRHVAGGDHRARLADRRIVRTFSASENTACPRRAGHVTDAAFALLRLSKARFDDITSTPSMPRSSMPVRPRPDAVEHRHDHHQRERAEDHAEERKKRAQRMAFHFLERGAH